MTGLSPGAAFTDLPVLAPAISGDKPKSSHRFSVLPQIFFPGPAARNCHGAAKRRFRSVCGFWFVFRFRFRFRFRFEFRFSGSGLGSCSETRAIWRYPRVSLARASLHLCIFAAAPRFLRRPPGIPLIFFQKAFFELKTTLGNTADFVRQRPARLMHNGNSCQPLYPHLGRNCCVDFPVFNRFFAGLLQQASLVAAPASPSLLSGTLYICSWADFVALIPESMTSRSANHFFPRPLYPEISRNLRTNSPEKIVFHERWRHPHSYLPQRPPERTARPIFLKIVTPV